MSELQKPFVWRMLFGPNTVCVWMKTRSDHISPHNHKKQKKNDSA